MVARLEMILAVFPAPEMGAKVLADLRKLEKAGRFRLHNAAVLHPRGQADTPARGQPGEEPESGSGEGTGNLLGNMLDQLKVPAGQTIGKAAGVVTGGSAGNGADLGFDRQTLEGLTAGLPAHSSALLAVMQEEWTEAVLIELEASQGKVYRQNARQSLAAQLRGDK